MYLDQKVTIWQRVHFNNEQDMQKAIEMLKKKEIETINDVCEHFEISSENLFETETKIEQPAMQGFQPTAGNADPQGSKPQTLQGVLSKLYSGGTN